MEEKDKIVKEIKRLLDEGIEIHPKSPIHKQLSKAMKEEPITPNKDYSVEKPPLGIMPKNFWVEDRINELSNAIDRYDKSGYICPSEWMIELEELVAGSKFKLEGREADREEKLINYLKDNTADPYSIDLVETFFQSLKK